MPPKPIGRIELGLRLAFAPAVGARRAEALEKAGMVTVEDLLWRLPFRHEDRSRLLRLKQLEPGRPATFRVEVVQARLVPVRRRGLTLLEATVRDAGASLKVTFFNQPYLRDVLVPGCEVFLYGTPARHGLFLELVNPQVEAVGKEDRKSVV